MAKASSKKAALKMTKDGKYPLYNSSAPANAYKKGEVVMFRKVRDWLDEGSLVEALGKVVNTGLFDNEVPYIEVSFDETKKLNKVDLGKDIRKFLLELK